MGAIVSFFLDNLDIFLTAVFALFPVLSILWESFVVGVRIQQERAREAAILQRLVTQGEQTAKKIDELHAETVAKNLLERPQLEAIVKSNETLGREVDYLSKTVIEEQAAIKELARFMYDKNRLVDALVMILKDLQQGLRATNGDLAMIVQHFNNLIVDVNRAKEDLLHMDVLMAEVKEAIGKNAKTNTKQFKDVYSKLTKQQESTDAFKVWAEGELKTLINSSSAGGAASKDVRALQIDLKHVKEYIKTMRDNLSSHSCDCSSTMGPKMNLMEEKLQQQRTAIKDMLEDYGEFKDDYYRSENVNGTAVENVMNTLHQSYATRDDVHAAFKQIHDEMVAGQCKCGSANTQQQPAQQEQEQEQEEHEEHEEHEEQESEQEQGQPEQQQQGEPQEDTNSEDNMVVDP